MLRRVIYENWQLIFPVVALLTAAAIYGFGFVRGLRMRPSRIAHLERLPLED